MIEKLSKKKQPKYEIDEICKVGKPLPKWKIDNQRSLKWAFIRNDVGFPHTEKRWKEICDHFGMVREDLPKGDGYNEWKQIYKDWLIFDEKMKEIFSKNEFAWGFKEGERDPVRDFVRYLTRHYSIEDIVARDLKKVNEILAASLKRLKQHHTLFVHSHTIPTYELAVKQMEEIIPILKHKWNMDGKIEGHMYLSTIES